MVILWSVSTSLTILLFIMFSISLAYQIALHREKRAKAESGPEPQAEAGGSEG